MKLKTRPPRIFRDKKKRLYIMFDGKKRLIKSSTKIHMNELTHNKLYMIMIQKLINKAFPKPRKRKSKSKEEDKDVVFSRNVKASNEPTQGGNSTTSNPFQSAQDVINAKNAPSSTQQTQQLMIKDAETKQLLLENANEDEKPVSLIKQRQIRNARIAKLTPSFENKVKLERRKMLKKLYPKLYNAKDKKPNDSIIDDLQLLLTKKKIVIPTVPSDMDLDDLNALTSELQDEADQQKMADQLERTKPSEQRRAFDEAVEDGKDPEAIAKEQEGAEESKAPTQETSVPEVVDDDDDEEDDGEEEDDEADVEDEGEEEGDEEDEGDEEADGNQKEWTTAEKAEIYVMNALC